MAEFTKEQLIDWAKGREANAELYPHFTVKDLALVEIALAALTAGMEQEPVGEVVLGDYDDCGDHPDAKVVCIAAQGQADWNNFRNGTKLYPAPQLPQPAVTDKLLAAMGEVLRISDRDHDAWHRAREGIADCRAAMLQGNHRDLSYPVDPQVAAYEKIMEQALPDGWVAVPVEATIDMVKAGASAASSGWLLPWIYQAMLAAAPQREAE